MSTQQTLAVVAAHADFPFIDDLARLAQTSRIDRSRQGVIRLNGVAGEQKLDLLGLCRQHRCDAGLVESERRFADFGLLVSDMDSTLISIECIDEIADLKGIKPQVAEITERAMRGELDFSAALRERVALLAGLPEAALQEVYEQRLRLNPGAAQLLAACREAGIRTLLVSGGFTYFTDRLKAELGLDEAHANQLEVIDGKLTGRVLGGIVDAETKQRLLIAARERLGLRPDQVLAVGDGANDLPMLREAGVGIAYHAKPRVSAEADLAVEYGGLDVIPQFFL
jgi:phosphoserine phosphatase